MALAFLGLVIGYLWERAMGFCFSTALYTRRMGERLALSTLGPVFSGMCRLTTPYFLTYIYIYVWPSST